MKENTLQASGPTRDISSKTVLGNPLLCAQFLRDYVNIPCFKNVQPEDIEDVSERYIPYPGTEFESDTVKRIRIRKAENPNSGKIKRTSNHCGHNRLQEPMFLISLTEHKSRVDYDVSMQLLKYMLSIWLDYGKEMQQKNTGKSNRKKFRYPVIIPVVYYEGKAPWTADCRFRARIYQGNFFQKWIPDFTYEVIRLHDYSNEELLKRGNEMSLIMLFNKIQDTMDLSDFLRLPQERLNEMVKDTPEPILDIIVSVIESLCGKIGATESETRKCVSKVRERRMGYLFENIEKMDIQAERRNTAQARADAVNAQKALRKAQEEFKESTIQTVINVCRRLNGSREQAIEAVMKECGAAREIAEQKVNEYWKI